MTLVALVKSSVVRSVLLYTERNIPCNHDCTDDDDDSDGREHEVVVVRRQLAGSLAGQRRDINSRCVYLKGECLLLSRRTGKRLVCSEALKLASSGC